jgi:hypothetical protein
VEFVLNYIEWESSVQNPQWVKEPELRATPKIVKTVGYVLKETLSAVTVAASISGDYYCAPLTIPKSCIKKRSITREVI